MFGSGICVPRKKSNVNMTTTMAGAGEEFDRLVSVMETLRSPDGCPWDRDQTLDSLTHFVLEEAHEVVETTSAPRDVGRGASDVLQMSDRRYGDA